MLETFKRNGQAVPTPCDAFLLQCTCPSHTNSGKAARVKMFDKKHLS
jgi:hypothetical protein